MTQFRDPKFVIAFLIIVLFAIAYMRNPGDEAMKGALIAAFSAGYGYYLGSSSSSNAIRGQMDKALDLAAAAQPTPPRPDVMLRPGETAQAEQQP